MSKKVELEWKVHLPNLLREVLENPTCAILAMPLSITGHLLHELADVAREIDDPRLHRMMLRLTLYEQADPASPHFNADAIPMMDQLIAEQTS